MNLKHGFTLIKLLAVIILLAIIALMVTPIILDIVEDARKNNKLFEIKYAVGDLLKVQVSDSETQNIYVLEVNGNEIVGILDRNLGRPVAWISEENYDSAGGNYSSDDAITFNQNLYEFGQITALAALNERTSSWNKVKEVEMPKAEEILKLTEFYQNLSETDRQDWESNYSEKLYASYDVECSSRTECIEAGYGDTLLPEWATINLQTTGDSSAGRGYWTSTPMAFPNIFSSFDCAWIVDENGFLDCGFVIFSDGIGVRPIIHIHESNILEKLDSSEYSN